VLRRAPSPGFRRRTAPGASFRSISSGTANAAALPIVRSVRRWLPAVARVAVVVVACTHVFAAVEPAHVLCMLARHGCHTTAVTAPCCCGGESQASRQTGPIAHVYRAITMLAVASIAAPPQVQASVTLLTVPLRATLLSPPDIVILLANLRL